MNSDDVRVALGSDVVARNLMQEIFNKDELPLATFLSSLGIHTLGRTTSKALAKEYRSLDAVRSATLLSLLRIDGIGDTSASAISEGLEAMSATIDRILEVIDVMEVEDASGPLAGMTFCLTGAMSRPRKVIAAEIESAGGEVRSSVGKGLSYLVQADPSSASSKSKKAKANGTEVIGEDKLKELMAS
jgi:DNA ligase (NAD+)